MKKIKLIMLCCIGTLCIASKSFGQANPFINVLPSNSGVVTVGSTIDIVVTIGNTGPVSTIAQAKLRPIIQVPASVAFLPNAQQTGLPTGWTILSNTGTQLRLCNSTGPIPVNTIRTITLKAQGVTVAPAQTFSGNINFGNGTTCAAGTSVAGDLTTDNSATSTIRVIGPTVVNLTCLIQGYWDAGNNAMLPVLANQGETSTATACDSIDVELHDINTYAMVQSVRTILNQNGTANCVFPSTSGAYYIVVKHRSAIQTWSAVPVTLGPTPVSYNFTTAASQAYGSNQDEVAPGVWALYSGDIVVDENIDLLDLGTLELDISNFSYGYVSSDLNGDGNVDLLDGPIMESNISEFVFSYHP